MVKFFKSLLHNFLFIHYIFYRLNVCVFLFLVEYYGIRDACPHAGFALADGEFDVTTGIVTCPEHGSRFDVHSGERIQGPADYSIKTYPVKVDGDDIYVYV